MLKNSKAFFLNGNYLYLKPFVLFKVRSYEDLLKTCCKIWKLTDEA